MIAPLVGLGGRKQKSEQDQMHEGETMSEQQDQDKTEKGQLESSSAQDATARRYVPNFGERARGIDAVVLPLGSVEAIERLARDLIAFGYGIGEATPESGEQLEWHEKAKSALDALMDNVRALASGGGVIAVDFAFGPSGPPQRPTYYVDVSSSAPHALRDLLDGSQP